MERERGMPARMGFKAGTHQRVGSEQNPFESVPAEFLGRRMTAVLAIEPRTVLVFIILAGHPRLPAPKRFDSTATFRQHTVDVRALAIPALSCARGGQGKLGRDIVDRE